MFSHIMLGADDVAASKKFYDAALGALGVGEGRVDPKGRAMYVQDRSIFMLTKPIDGNPASHANGMRLYLAYLRDPSGNKICAMCREA